MATKDRTSLKNDFANGKYAIGEKFADLIDSMKVVQLPVVDPAASGTSLSFIDSISQDEDGKITATKKRMSPTVGSFRFVANDATAEAAFTAVGAKYSGAISGVSPSADTLGVILLMNDDDTTPTKTMMITTEEVTPATNPETYQFVYVGDLQSALPSGVLTAADIVNGFAGGVDKVLSAEAGQNLLKIAIKGFDLYTGSIGDDGVPTTLVNYKHTSMFPVIDSMYAIIANVKNLQYAFYYSAPTFSAESFIQKQNVQLSVPEGAKYVSYLFKNQVGDDVLDYSTLVICRMKELGQFLSDGYFGICSTFYKIFSIAEYNNFINLMKYKIMDFHLYGDSVDVNGVYNFRFGSWTGSGIRVILQDSGNTSTLIDGIVQVDSTTLIYDGVVTNNGYSIKLKVDLNGIEQFSHGQINWNLTLNPRAFLPIDPESPTTELEERVTELETDVEGISNTVGSIDHVVDNSFDVSVNRTINLFNIDTITDNTYIRDNNGVEDIHSNSTVYLVSDYIEIDHAKSYYLKYFTEDGEAVSGTNQMRYACFYNSVKEFISGVESTQVLPKSGTTIPSTAKYVRISLNKNNNPTYRYAVLSEGSVASEYMPYTIEEIKLNEKVIPTPNINLPETIYGVVGDTIQLFWRSIIDAPNLDEFYIVANAAYKYCDSQPRYIEITPTSTEIGTKKLTVYLYNKNHEIAAQKTVNIVVKGAPQSPQSNKNILLVGDSITAKGYIGYELNRRLATNTGDGTPFFPTGLNLSGLSFVGRTTGQYTDIHQEATGGRRIEQYISIPEQACRFYFADSHTVKLIQDGDILTNNGIAFTVSEVDIEGKTILGNYESNSSPEASGTLVRQSDSLQIQYISRDLETTNPFWDFTNERDNFIKYCNDNNISGGIDYMVLYIGINDLYTGGKTPEEIADMIDTFITQFHSDYSTAKVVLCELPLTQYGSGYRKVRKEDNFQRRASQIFQLNKLLEQMAHDETHVGYTIFCPVASQFDCEYGYSKKEVNKNNRVNDYKDVLAGGDAIHPRAPYTPKDNPSWSATINTSPNGFYLIADAMYRCFVYELNNL